MTEEQFLLAIRESFTDYCAAAGKTLKFGTQYKLSFLELKVNLLGQFMEIIEYYFRTTTSGDENFFTADEIQNVIDHVNRIMGTTFYTDLG